MPLDTHQVDKQRVIMGEFMTGAIDSTDTIEHADAARAAADLGPWFHNLHLPDGTQTAPDCPLGDFPAYKWNAIAPYVPENLNGWRVLDIGCNAGFYTFELAKRGARVLGIDADPHYLAQAEWAARQFDLSNRVEFRRMQVYELARWSETFDMVLFMGLLYHLRYPLLGLDIVTRTVGKLMILQTALLPGEEVAEDTSDCGLTERESMLQTGWPSMAFVEHSFCGDPTNWWIANRACVEAMLRSSGMRVIARPEAETLLCEPDPNNPSCITTWDAAEFRAATGMADC